MDSIASNIEQDAAASGNEDSDAYGLNTPTKICSTPEYSKDESESKESSAKESPKLNVNDKLKETLEKHGISRQDADSFLLGLLKNRDFKNLVKTTNLDDEDSSEGDESSIPAAPMTRAKLKEAMLNSPFKVPEEETCKATPKFTEITLPEDDDDEEYQPVEESFGSDTQDPPPMEEKHAPMNAPDEGLGSAKKNDEHSAEDLNDMLPLEVNESVNNTAEGGDDIISKRTRSKHSLQSTSLDVLEAAFDPPDATPDMYDCTDLGDYDWHQWLADLMKTEQGKGNAVEEEDNPDEDPDFDFTPELDKPDAEDMRNDQSVQVSDKELYGLLNEVETMHKHDWPPVAIKKNPPADTFPRVSSPKKQTKVKSAQRKWSSNEPIQLDVPELLMSHSQIELVNQQIQQHIQLLAQVNILCRNIPDLEDCVMESRELLLELQNIGDNQLNLLDIKSSHVTPWCLKEAISLTETNVPHSDPVVRLLGKEVNKGHESITKSVAEVMGNSRVFMYRELLPLSGPSFKSNAHKIPFRPAEDCLVALGLAQMNGMENIYELISQHMLPTKTDKQIQVRIRNVLSCRNLKDAVNPIRKYHVCHILPMPRTDIKYVYQETAKKPLDMEGSLPCWVLALKPVFIPPESSDDSSCELQPAAPSNLGTGTHQVDASPVKAVMVPFSIVHAVPVSLPLVPSITGAKVSLGNVSTAFTKFCGTASSTSVDVSTTVSASSYPSLSTAVIPTSLTADPISSSKIQPNAIYGRRQSAGKSIMKLSESTVISLSSSSSSSSEDEAELEEKMGPSTPIKEDVIPSDTEEHLRGGSDEDQTDHDLEEKSKPSVAIPSVSAGNMKEAEDSESIPVGGYLQKIHPKLTGKKGKPGSRDLRRAKSTAKIVKSLEEDTIMQLDPKRIEKEKMFAAGYLERVEKSLKCNPDLHKQFLETLVKYGDGTKSPVDLYFEMSSLLRDWPDLLQSFAPFLMPEQAHECGLNAEQEVYARARKFLRQLEIQFSNNPGHMDKILNVFHNIAETAIYREEEMMKSILKLLKDHPYLQDEFLTFFDDQPPPKILFDEDFEEVDLTDEVLKDPSVYQYEFVNLPLEAQETDIVTPQEIITKKPRRRKVSLGSREECKLPAKATRLNDDKENISPELANSDMEDDVEETGNTDYESEDAMPEDVADDLDADKQSTSVPPDLAVISEDAQSSSPFKRITGEATLKPAIEPLRPDTPTGLRSDDTTSATLSSTSLPPRKSSEELPTIPMTPGKSPPSKRDSDLSHLDNDAVITNEAINPGVMNLLGSSGDAGVDVNVSLPQEQLDIEPTLPKVSLTMEKADSCVIEDNVVPKPPPTAVENEEIVPATDDPSTSAGSRDTGTGWTRQSDEIILTACQRGITPSMFAEVGAKLGRTATEVETRLNQLLKFFNGNETDDGVSQESEEDGDIFSDSSVA